MRDVTPAEEGKVATVATLQLGASFDLGPAEMASQIRADIEHYERMSRDAALIALRVGLRLIWIRDNEPHGSLLKFMAQHFADKSQRALYNYIRLADGFLTDCGLRDRKTFKLTGKALTAVAPICAVQLELFSDPEAKLAGALKRVIKWVGDRGLAQIYRDIEAKPPGSMPPRTGKGGRPAESSITPEMRREVALECGDALVQYSEGKSWEWLEDDELAELDRILDKFHQGVAELLKARRDAEAAAARGTVRAPRRQKVETLKR